MRLTSVPPPHRFWPDNPAALRLYPPAAAPRIYHAFFAELPSRCFEVVAVGWTHSPPNGREDTARPRFRRPARVESRRSLAATKFSPPPAARLRSEAGSPR